MTTWITTMISITTNFIADIETLLTLKYCLLICKLLKMQKETMEMVDADDSFKLLALRRKLKSAAGCLTRTPDGLKKLLIEEFGNALTLIEA